MDATEAVRQNIARLRNAKSMTYVALTERLEAVGCRIPVLGLRRIERGERRVEVGELVAFATVFGRSTEELLFAPDDCPTCHGEPPSGFTCNTCGKNGA